MLEGVMRRSVVKKSRLLDKERRQTLHGVPQQLFELFRTFFRFFKNIFGYLNTLFLFVFFIIKFRNF